MTDSFTSFTRSQLREILGFLQSYVWTDARSRRLVLAAATVFRACYIPRIQPGLSKEIGELKAQPLGRRKSAEFRGVTKSLYTSFRQVETALRAEAKESDSEALRNAADLILDSPFLGHLFDLLTSQSNCELYYSIMGTYAEPKTSPSEPAKAVKLDDSISGLSRAKFMRETPRKFADVFPFLCEPTTLASYYRILCSDEKGLRTAIREKVFVSVCLKLHMRIDDPLFLLPLATLARAALIENQWYSSVALVRYYLDHSQTMHIPPFEGNLSQYLARFFKPSELMRLLALCAVAKSEIDRLAEQALPDGTKHQRRALCLITSLNLYHFEEDDVVARISRVVETSYREVRRGEANRVMQRAVWLAALYPTETRVAQYTGLRFDAPEVLELMDVCPEIAAFLVNFDNEAEFIRRMLRGHPKNVVGRLTFWDELRGKLHEFIENLLHGEATRLQSADAMFQRCCQGLRDQVDHITDLLGRGSRAREIEESYAEARKQRESQLEERRKNDERLAADGPEFCRARIGKKFRVVQYSRHLSRAQPGNEITILRITQEGWVRLRIETEEASFTRRVVPKTMLALVEKGVWALTDSTD